jgi:hypothetical protein
VYFPFSTDPYRILPIEPLLNFFPNIRTTADDMAEDDNTNNEQLEELLFRQTTDRGQQVDQAIRSGKHSEALRLSLENPPFLSKQATTKVSNECIQLQETFIFMTNFNSSSFKKLQR